MEPLGCPHEHIACISSHEDLVTAQEQGEPIAFTYVCSSRTCTDLARQFVRSSTGRGVTHWISLHDLDED